MGDSWHAFKTGFARTRQKVLAKVGQAEVTKSPEYEEECNKTLNLQRTMKRVHENTGKYLEIMRALIAEQEAILEDILLISELASPAKQATNSVEAERDKMAQAFGQLIDTPLSGYMFQFKELKDRMDELEIRRVDMDRYFRDYNTIMAKSHPDPARVTHIETKYNVTKEGYTALFNEMMEDMPKLLAHRAKFFEPIVATFVKNHAAFYTGAVSAYGSALASVSGINEEQIHSHKPPIGNADKKPRDPSISTVTTPAYPPISSVQTPTQPPNPTPTYVPASNPTPTFAPNPIQTPTYAPTPTPTPTYAPSSIQTPTYTPTPTQTPTRAPAQVQTPQYDPAPAPAASQAPSVYAPPMTSGASGTTKARANFDFMAQEEDEISFKKGDVLIIHEKDGDWWVGEINGARGTLPSNYVTEF